MSAKSGCLLALCALLVHTCAAGADEYRVGGPLAGLKQAKVTGSPEHWQPYFGHTKTFFDRQSRVRRWVAPGIPGGGAADELAKNGGMVRIRIGN